MLYSLIINLLFPIEFAVYFQNRMDISYQKDAFAALSERHKKAMFQNAKLKDEVALQGVGLNNLGSRLGKQTQQYEICNSELKLLNKRVSRRRFVIICFTSVIYIYLLRTFFL